MTKNDAVIFRQENIGVLQSVHSCSPRWV